MKRRAISGLIAAIALTASFVIFAQDKSAAALLQDGMKKETLEGDIKGAIVLYQKALEAAGSTDRAVAARALLRLGTAYKRQGDEKARATLQRVTEFTEQKQIVAEARGLLDSMTVTPSPKTPNIHPVAAGDDADPASHVTFDGRYMSRPDRDTGGLAIRDMSTGRVSRLARLALKAGTAETPGAYASNAIVSPDGKHIVYMWFPDDKQSPNYKLMVRPVAGDATARTLVDASRYCCFLLIGWAEDGRIFLTISSPDGTWEIASVTLTDPKVKRLRAMDWRLRGDRPSLSPDGKYIAYSALATNPGSAVGRSQKLPASVSADQFIYVLPTDGSGEETPVVQGGIINESPVWTRDGKHILFVSNRSSTFALYSIAVENGAAAGNPTLVPMNIPGKISPIGMTKSDSLYYLPQSTPGGFDVFLADLKSGKLSGRATLLQQTLFDWNRGPAWSPDGARIAFKRRRPNENNAVFDLIVYTLATQKEKPYAYNWLDNSPPIWFHDSNSLLLRRNNALVRLDLDTGRVIPLEQIAHSVLPQGFVSGVLSPDDKALYVNVARQPEPGSRTASIVAMDLELGGQMKIWESADPAVSLHNLALSPDGKTLAMTLSKEAWAQPHLGRIRIGIDKNTYTDLASSVSEGMFTWTRDGSAILFAEVSSDEGRMMRVAANGKLKPEFTGLVLSQACACGHTVDLNADGSRIVFSDATREGNVLYVLENVSTLLKSPR